MVINSQSQQGESNREEPVHHRPFPEQADSFRQEPLHKLQEALWDSAALNTILWNYRISDWVTNVQATDIDNDGDIEILVGARNGVVMALTPWEL
ncbi:hypothetical protein [Dictyobacter kobayashii]|uniref:VCBS repeat-containing protein n=1 Tax=Dictyobacter kobayashii TaxID=2014872 RepID=A0A402AXW3_9CHLR|nr:hypothetical protein [Dictyobacter kobayashii]GCE23946.1 hypothetical protein KDK_77460 [Dictyobacter kobayashii]